MDSFISHHKFNSDSVIDLSNACVSDYQESHRKSLGKSNNMVMVTDSPYQFERGMSPAMTTHDDMLRELKSSDGKTNIAAISSRRQSTLRAQELRKNTNNLNSNGAAQGGAIRDIMMPFKRPPESD
jgi:hypothetical protein